MKNYFDLKNLPVLSDRKRVMQTASFDRMEENGDWGKFLYKDADGSMVMLDETTPGCIKSIWVAIATDEANMKFYFDGESTPKYECTVRGFFNGAIPELSGVGNTFLERGQWPYGDCYCGNFFIPVPYEKGLKITVDGDNLEFYYHIMYERYDSDDAAELCHVGVSEEFVKAFREEYDHSEGPYTYEKELELIHAYMDVYNAETPGVITEFALEYAEDVDVSKVKIDIALDNDPISKVACPITCLFAEPLGYYTGVNTVAARTRKENGVVKMSCYLPMPYWEKISISAVYFEKEPIKIKIKLKIEENRYDRDETGHLYAYYRCGATELFDDWKFGEFSGRGQVVGFVQTARGAQWCEGNEHFYIDGELSPSINGTGTEDFYLGCYFPNKKYDSPVAGCVNNILPEGELTAPDVDAGYYRYMLDMPISFEDGIKLMIQHGAVGQTYSYYSSAVFYYRQPLAKMAMTDYIDVSAPFSRESHSYVTYIGDTQSPVLNGVLDNLLYKLTGKIEGERNSPVLSKRGLLHSGKVAFKAATNSENRGVVIRILTDMNYGPEKVRVIVDGHDAGVWSMPEENTHAPYGDYDFYIPKSLTEGKNTLSIELIPEGKFADFEYKILTRLK
ncbi:MAG: DUF2961 domain-containing protein [Clostridia bacterium]|nr:DUF2961 domain-containing protein [Clostridia bacterium]